LPKEIFNRNVAGTTTTTSSLLVFFGAKLSAFNAARQLLCMNELAAEIAKLLLPRDRKDVVHERRSAVQDAEAYERLHYG